MKKGGKINDMKKGGKSITVEVKMNQSGAIVEW